MLNAKESDWEHEKTGEIMIRDKQRWRESKKEHD